MVGMQTLQLFYNEEQEPSWSHRLHLVGDNLLYNTVRLALLSN